MNSLFFWYVAQLPWSTTIPHACLAHFCGTFRPAPRSGHENRRVKKTRPQRQKVRSAGGRCDLPEGICGSGTWGVLVAHGPFNGDFLVGYKGDLNTRAAELEVGEAIIKHTAEFRIPHGKG